MKNNDKALTEREIQLAAIAYILGEQMMRARLTERIGKNNQKIISSMLEELKSLGDKNSFAQITNRVAMALFRLLS